ncbi:hypothetical protein PG997_010088 [Apiospora hydei]|uniref:Uncharacterized protein n=1 Tax=Apiospora hydei TaxID=1337664 RepID=A0ABR1VZ31_9PEZI
MAAICQSCDLLFAAATLVSVPGLYRAVKVHARRRSHNCAGHSGQTPHCQNRGRSRSRNHIQSRTGDRDLELEHKKIINTIVKAQADRTSSQENLVFSQRRSGITITRSIDREKRLQLLMNNAKDEGL